MTEASSANWEMATVLPLGVVANQLMRIEAQLRRVNMKALDCANVRENGRLPGLLEARLEQIHEALDSIGGLVSDIEADIQPRSADAHRTSTKVITSPIGTHLPMDDTRPCPDAVEPQYSNRGPHSDRDD
jgi:hypothetical protein